MSTTVNNIVFEWDEEKIESTNANTMSILKTLPKFFLTKIALNVLIKNTQTKKIATLLLAKLKKFYLSFIRNAMKKHGLFLLEEPISQKGKSIMAMVTYILREGTPLTPEQEKRLEALSKMSDDDIVYDEDCPKLTEEQLAQFKRVNPLPKKAVG